MMTLTAPKTNRYFWWFHFSLWGAFSLINFFSRQFNQVESLEQGVVSMVVLLVINTLLCLILRELIHRFKLNDLNTPKIWLKLSALIIIFGFISALLMTLALGLYFLLAGYTQHLVFFMITVYQNWLIMALTVGLWAVVYVVIMHMQTLNQLKTEQQQVQLQLKEAELNNLAGQLNPHFLFNGLNNIRALINEDGAKARHILTELSELLRHSLNAPKSRFTPIAQELDMVRAYVELAQIQYEERLQYQEHIDSSLNHVLIPPLMIQLLIENAIRHGIDHHQGQGVLKLEIQTQDNDLIIRVSNPGKITHTERKSSGIGLANISKRLQLLFADEQSFSLNELAGQVVAELKMPLIKELPQ
jgi:two-component system LytT family sensor kinase